jgi:hypothetical protein
METEIDDHNIIKNSAAELMKLILPMYNSTDNLMAGEYMNFIMYAFNERKLPNGTEITLLHEEYLLKSLEVSGEFFSERRNYRQCMSELEQMVQKTVIPYLTCEHDILRVRACSVIESFGPIEFENNETYKAICNGLCQNMQHEKLAVQVKAVLALDYFLQNQIVRDMLVGDIQSVLNTVLTLLSKIELDSLVDAL